MVEVTYRTVGGLYLLRPSTELNRVLVGILARAQELSGIAVHAALALSTHIHLLLSAAHAEQVSRAMQYFGGQSAREINRLTGWSGRVWGRRYRMIPISDEEEAQIGRLRYVLENGCKEGLVASPTLWPGLTSVHELLQGHAHMSGDWIDRTKLYRARQKARRKSEALPRERDFTSGEKLPLTPLPCWEHLRREERCARVQELVSDIEHETRARHEREKTRPFGVRKILAVHPLSAPERPKRSPAPLFHAATKAARLALIEAYRRFLVLYCEASAALRRGVKSVVFPEGCFPPRPSFVPVPRARDPG